MGQSISRRVVPRLNEALKKYEKAAAKDAMEDTAKRQSLARRSGDQTGGYSDPNAVHGGFRRENAPRLPQEAAQEQFLRREQGDAPTEMPEDLLKFINDNPLEKQVDRELTSPKVYDSLVEDGDGAGQQQQRTPRTRTRRTMPLAESMIEDLPDDVSSDIAGATGVQRTTNFSTANMEGDDDDKLDRLLRMTDKDLAGLLRQYGATDGDNSTASAAKHDESKNPHSIEAKRMDAESYLANKVPPGLSDERRVEHTSLVANALLCNGMPSLMKDVDSDFVGVWSGRVRDMERMKLRVVEDKETTIVFEKRAGGGEDGVGDESVAKGANADTSAATATTDDAVAPADTVEPIDDAKTPVRNAASEVIKEEMKVDQESSLSDDWKEVIEEKKKIKGRVGSSGPATRKFLEEEAARAAAGSKH